MTAKEKILNAIIHTVAYTPSPVVKKIAYSSFREDIRKGIEQQRIERFIQNTDFDSLDISRYPICEIRNSLFDYPLFQICFLDDMLNRLIVNLSFGRKPYLTFCTKEEPDQNLWENFFVQPYPIDESISVDNYVEEIDPIFQNYFPTGPSTNEIALYSKLFKKYVMPNESTRQYFEDEVQTIFGEKRRILGVLSRGTDYVTTFGLTNETKNESVEFLITQAKEALENQNFDYIYLATEERRIEERFRDVFGYKVLVNKRQYFDDSFYSLNPDTARISQVGFGRKRDSYYKSLEYLSSINLLSQCDALIGINCGGTRAALFMNDQKYEFHELYQLSDF